ncbi:hypothetical protein N7533_000431 [Penicillium manginii]|jgi:hypothetical protein|uniref:uncharacterized protein n=1 Tax=Penicillium manginii TaxID=203109 RepID=UPI002546C698|nr:uncharacterized protein N7533_000431 [Penicillium manginii]KAJ5767848.1 hypothetical protein N7533_000431 [Penicillium manginii]
MGLFHSILDWGFGRLEKKPTPSTSSRSAESIVTGILNARNRTLLNEKQIKEIATNCWSEAIAKGLFFAV